MRLNSRRRLLIGLTGALAVLVAIDGCGEQTDASQVTDRASRPHRVSSAAVSIPTGPAVWGRHDIPPAGVRRQIAYFGTGDEICGAPSALARPTIVFDRQPYYDFQTSGGVDPEIGEFLSICPRGFADNEPVTLELRRPDGRRETTILPASDEVTRLHSIFLDERWPVGVYGVTAQQGESVARTRFRVVEPRHHGVRVALMGRTPRLIPVMVVGEPARSRVIVDVYRDHGLYYRYITSFGLSTDRHGVAEMLLPVFPRDHGLFVLRPRDARHLSDHDVDASVSL